MKRTVLSILAGLAAGAVLAQTEAVPAAAPAHPAKIAVINVERLVQESALGKEAFARVKKLNDQKKEEADKLGKELRDMEQKLADQGQSMTDDKREQLQKRVLPVIQQVGKEKGFTLIFNKFQSGLVYADEGVDVTDDVLKRFNTTVAVPAAKAETAAPQSAPPKPAPTKKPAGH